MAGMARGDGFRSWAERAQADASASEANKEHVGAALGTLTSLVAELPSDLTADERQVARSLLESLWRRLMHVTLPALATDTFDERVSKAIAEIERRYAEPTFRLRGLARQLGVSDCRLTQLLKQATGRTFGECLHARRIAEARLLLADSTLSVKEIAGRVGYSATSLLDRHFKKIEKRLPSAFRAEMYRARGIAARQHNRSHNDKTDKGIATHSHR